MPFGPRFGPLVAVLVLSVSIFCACVSNPVQGEDYYALAEANFKLEKYESARFWFLKAQASEKTRAASEYYLGRIAFELGDYSAALAYFEGLLEEDQNNVMLLKAVAFTALKKGDMDRALTVYDRVIELVPAGPAVNYNYALLLYTAGRRDRAVSVLSPYVEANPNDKDALLLLARAYGSSRDPRALEYFDAYLALSDEAMVRREAAEASEAANLFSKAAEYYQTLVDSGKETAATIIAGDVHFALARALFISGGEGASDSLALALSKGFQDRAALEAFTSDPRIILGDEDRKRIERALMSPEERAAAEAAAAEAAAAAASVESSDAIDLAEETVEAEETDESSDTIDVVEESSGTVGGAVEIVEPVETNGGEALERIDNSSPLDE